jgi:D-ribose pyranase
MIGPAFMAEEFRTHNAPAVIEQRLGFLPQLSWEPHPAFKLRVPGAIGLIRTGDTTPYANVILESA